LGLLLVWSLFEQWPTVYGKCLLSVKGKALLHKILQCFVGEPENFLYFCSPNQFRGVRSDRRSGFVHLRKETVNKDSMYAIVTIAGQQFKVEKDRKVFVHRLGAEEGASVEFDEVLLVEDESGIKVGAPVLSGAKVTAKVLSHLKGDKVIVFKKKRRKGYKKKNGHRQYLSQIQIEDIVIG